MLTLKRNAGSPRSYGARLRRLRAELNNTRLTLLVALLFTMLVAAIFPTPAIRFMVALLCAGPFVSAAMARFFGRSVRASRFLPETAAIGEIVSGRIELWNEAAYPVFFAQVVAGESAAPLDGVPPLEAIGGDQLIPVLQAGERLPLTPQWKANRRGVWTLSPVVAGSCDPLGISSFLSPRTGAQEIVVLPHAIPLMRLGFLTDSASGTRGYSHPMAVTEAMEFHGIRAWRPGEGIRRVHWKSTARTGQLHVIEWEEDLSSDVSIMLDTQVSPGFLAGALSDTLETAITLAASVAAHVLESGQSVELFHWQQAGEKDELKLIHYKARSASGLAATMQQLAQVQTVGATALPDDPSSLEHLVQQCVASIAADSSVLLLSPDKTRITAVQNSLATGGIPMRRCTAVVIEGADVRQTSASQVKNTVKHSETSDLLAPKVPGMRTRILSSGASLSAFLEKEL